VVIRRRIQSRLGRLWHQHLDALTRHLDGKEQTHGDS